MSAFAADALEDLIHVRARLAVLALLSTAGSVDFVSLREQIQISDGNLSLHLKKLDEAGYVRQKKGFESKKPKTVISLTPAGRDAFYAYLQNLQLMLGSVPQREDDA